MSVRTRRRSTATAIALTAGITAGATMLLTACGTGSGTSATGAHPSASASATATPTASASASNSPSAQPTATATSAGNGSNAAPAADTKPVATVATVAKRNGTAHNGLTISDGSRYVVMNGTRVDFGTQVRDLAWSPNGKKAAFIDGDGDLAVSNPDGSGRVIAARNPGNQNWSHPTWQVRAYEPQNGVPATNTLFFAGRKGSVSRLYSVPATAHNAAPALLGLNHESGDDVKSLPQTGNVWPSAAGNYGDAAYANADDGMVYIRDDYLRQQGYAVTQGSEPAMAPATQEEDIVFVRSVGGHDHLFLETPTNSGPTYKDLTPHATTDYTEPAFSPDGRTIAARTPTGIVTLPVDGSHAPVKVSDYLGLPAYRG